MEKSNKCSVEAGQHRPVSCGVLGKAWTKAKDEIGGPGGVNLSNLARALGGEHALHEGSTSKNVK